MISATGLSIKLTDQGQHRTQKGSKLARRETVLVPPSECFRNRGRRYRPGECSQGETPERAPLVTPTNGVEMVMWSSATPPMAIMASWVERWTWSRPIVSMKPMALRRSMTGPLMAARYSATPASCSSWCNDDTVSKAEASMKLTRCQALRSAGQPLANANQSSNYRLRLRFNRSCFHLLWI